MRLFIALFAVAVLAVSADAADRAPRPMARAKSAALLAYAALTGQRVEVQANHNPACACDNCDCDPCRCQPAESPEITRKTVSYKDAHERFVREGKPMVVMVTASWCPHCPPVKSDLERRLRDGELDNCSLVILDYDQATQTAKKVMGPYSHLPHVAVYYREGSKERVQRAVQTRHLHRYIGR